jgi:HPt (histidine-containing phosphotransfer) domain-containing protein
LRDAAKAIPVLSSTNRSDLKLFVTTAHAMKSALANVGNSELSEFARLLETAGRENNIDFIEENTPDFIEKLAAITEKLKPKEKTLTEPEDFETLHKTLSEIAAACENYDSDAADKLLAKLREDNWSEKTTDILSEIGTELLHAEFEKAAELCLSV